MDSRRFRKQRFSNGLTVVSERLPGFKSVSIGFWIRAGTRDETSSEAGISHFLEHMLFKGTQARSAFEIAREIDKVGGEFNAFTSREHTCFHVNLLGRDLGLAVDILSDVVLNSAFESVEIERERKVILQEVAMVEENPEELVFDAVNELLFGNRGLGRPILGTESSLRRLTRSTLVKYFRKHYRPGSMVVAVAGNFSPDKLKAALKPLLKRDWPGRPRNQKPRASLAEGGGSSKPKPGCWWIKRPTEQVHLVWSVEGPKNHSKDRYAVSLLNLFLGGGMSSILFQEIREKTGMAYTVYSSLSSYRDTGVFSIYAAVAPGRVDASLKRIEETVQKVRNFAAVSGTAEALLDEATLDELKENLKGNVLLSSENSESRMLAIANYELSGEDSLSAEEVCRHIDRVTLNDMKRVARKLFSGPSSLVFLGPRPGPKFRKKYRPQFPKKFN